MKYTNSFITITIMIIIIIVRTSHLVPPSPLQSPLCDRHDLLGHVLKGATSEGGPQALPGHLQEVGSG